MLWVKSIASEPHRVDGRLDEMCVKCGYPNSLLSNHRRKLGTVNRNSLLSVGDKPSNEPNLFISTYSRLSTKVPNILKSNFDLFSRSTNNKNTSVMAVRSSIVVIYLFQCS